MKRSAAKMLVGALAVMLLFTGCGRRGAAESAAADTSEAAAAVTGTGIDLTQEGLKIGFSAGNMDSNAVLWEEGISQALSSYPNIELTTFDAGGSGEKQVQQFEEMISQGYNAIICNALDTSALAAVTTEAEKEGIRVVHMNIGPESPHTAGLNNSSWNIGVMVANDVMAKMDSAKCVAIGPPVSMEAIAQGVTAFEETLKGKDGFEFLDSQAGDWTTETANKLTRDLLTKYNNEFDVIFCHSDQMAIGAAQAVDAAGLTGKIKIYGADGLQEALTYIKEGKMEGSVYCNGVQQGIQTTQICLYAMATGIDGSSLAATPEITAPVLIIDPSNVDEYLE